VVRSSSERRGRHLRNSSLKKSHNRIPQVWHAGLLRRFPVISITGAAWDEDRDGEYPNVFSVSAKVRTRAKAEPVRKSGSLFSLSKNVEPHFDNFQFERCFQQQPVGASTRIAYEDYVRMQTHRKKVSGERQSKAPVWAVHDKLLRQLIVEYVEHRVFTKKYRERNPDMFKGSPAQRLNFAEREFRVRKNPELLRTLDKLCWEYVELRTAPNEPDRARLELLESEIRNVDTSLRFNEHPGAYASAIVFLYWRVGMDSPAVGAELGLNPVHVRQVLCRLGRVWKQMNKRCRT
jgi:hypothetical protein